MSFLGPFMGTFVLTLASLGVLIVLRSDRAETDQRERGAQYSTPLGCLSVASIPLAGALFIFNYANGAAKGGYDFSLFGIFSGAILGFFILGRTALVPKSKK